MAATMAHTATVGMLTNTAQTLIEIARDPDVTLQRIADTLDITQRGAFNCVRALEQIGYVSHVKIGRRNRYTIDRDAPITESVTVGDFLDLFGPVS